MAAKRTGNIILFLNLISSVRIWAFSMSQPPSCQEMIETFSCGDTTLENGDTVTMVIKSVSSEEAWWLRGITELKAGQRFICAKPDCISNPCVNGGTCKETLTGFECSCTAAYYGDTCSCDVILTSDTLATRVYTFPGLTIAPEMTSFDFEVSADFDVHIGLSPVDQATTDMYEMAIGGWSNTGGALRRCISCPLVIQKYDPKLQLSGIPSYDHYEISFAEGNMKLFRVGDSTPLMEYNDANPHQINYVGIWTGHGGGSWKFPSLCN